MRTAELLQGYHGVIELLVVIHNDFLVVAFTDDETSVTPTEVVHAPERVHGKKQTVHRIPVGEGVSDTDDNVVLFVTHERM